MGLKHHKKSGFLLCYWTRRNSCRRIFLPITHKNMDANEILDYCLAKKELRKAFPLIMKH